MIIAHMTTTSKQSSLGDEIEIHPDGVGCSNYIAPHHWNITFEMASFRYKVCGRCGTVQIGDRLP